MKDIGVKKISIFNILIILLPIMMYIKLGITLNISLADFLLPVVLLIVLFDMKNRRNKFVKSNLPVIYIQVINLILIISLYKIILTYGLNSFVSSSISVIKLMINFVYFLLFIYAFKYYGNSFEKTFLSTWNYTSILVSLLCIIGVILYNIGIDNNWTYGFRATGPFEDPNLAATYLFISIGISSIYNYKKNKNVLSYNLILQIISILLTASRAAMIILVVYSFIAIFIIMKNNNIKLIEISLKVLGLGILFFILFNLIGENTGDNFFSSTLDRLTSGTKDIMEDSRLTKWKNAIIVWLNNPILGAGIGMYIDKKIMLGLGSDRIVAHNTYLSILAELGIVGFVSFFYLPIKSYLNLYKFYNKFTIEYAILIFSTSALFISQLALNLENFRCMWVYYAFLFYYIEQLRKGCKYE